MSNDRNLVLGLPAGVTVEIHQIDTEEAKEIMKQYPNMKGDLTSIVVISGLSVQQASKYSKEIQAEMVRLQG